MASSAEAPAACYEGIQEDKDEEVFCEVESWPAVVKA